MGGEEINTGERGGKDGGPLKVGCSYLSPKKSGKDIEKATRFQKPKKYLSEGHRARVCPPNAGTGKSISLLKGGEEGSPKRSQNVKGLSSSRVEDFTI